METSITPSSEKVFSICAGCLVEFDGKSVLCIACSETYRYIHFRDMFNKKPSEKALLLVRGSAQRLNDHLLTPNKMTEEQRISVSKWKRSTGQVLKALTAHDKKENSEWCSFCCFWLHADLFGGSGYCKSCRSTMAKNRITPIQRRNNHIKRTYGLSLEDYQQMLEIQNYACASCGVTETGIDARTGKLKNLHVDHDHSTGQVRALLCGGCNSALGMLQDDPEKIIALYRYIQRFK